MDWDSNPGSITHKNLSLASLTNSRIHVIYYFIYLFIYIVLILGVEPNLTAYKTVVRTDTLYEL